MPGQSKQQYARLLLDKAWRGQPLERVYRRGEDNENAKLTDRQVGEIRQLYRRGLGQVLALSYGVSQPQIIRIVSGQSRTPID